MTRDVQSDWLTATEATSYLGMPSLKALYQAVRRGVVPAHRLGRLLRFHRPELDRALLRTTSRVSYSVDA